MNPHGIQVFHVAHGNTVVPGVPNHLVLDLFPALEALLNENLLSAADMQKAVAAGAADFYMPDAQRIGGVSGWLRAAALAQVHDLELSSHLFPEISRHLLAVSPTCHWLEYMDWADPILAEPVVIEGGHAPIPDRPGCGLEWDEDAVEKYAAT